MLEDRLHIYNDIVFSCFLPDDWLNEFRMPYHALINVYSGVMNIEYAGKSLSVKAGQYVFLRRDHHIRLHKTSYENQSYKAINICLKGDTLQRYYRQHKDLTKIRETKRLGEAAIILPHIVATDNLFASLSVYTDKGNIPESEYIDNMISDAIDCLLKLDEKFYPTLFDFCETWKIDLYEFMESNYTSDLTMKEFALYTGRSLATFKRDFAKFSELPPEKWLVKRRLEKAYEMLKDNNLPVSEICWKVGFRNRSHFTTAFKREFGVLPSSIK